MSTTGVISPAGVDREDGKRTSDVRSWFNSHMAAVHRKKMLPGLLIMRPQFNAPHRRRSQIEICCVACGAGSDGLWVVCTFNTLHGAGCPVCKSVDSLNSDIQRSHLSKTHITPILERLGPPNVHDLQYRISVDSGLHREPVTRHQIKRWIREGYDPFETIGRLSSEVRLVEAEFKQAFPDGSFSVAEDRPSRSDRTITTLRFCVDTGLRVIRKRLTIEASTFRRVKELIGSERKDRELDQQIREEAERHGATILRYHHDGQSTFKIEYTTRIDERRLHTVHRARETHWGHGKWKGQQLCGLIFRLLYPDALWQFNTRPIKNGESRLELDGYAADLGLAFEFQGRQHIQHTDYFHGAKGSYEDQKERDDQKPGWCAERGIVFITVFEDKLRPAHMRQEIQLKLAENGKTDFKDFSDEQLSESWLQLSANFLKGFQERVARNMGPNNILHPPLDRIHHGSMLTYTCSTCGSVGKIPATYPAYAKHAKNKCTKCKNEKTKAEATKRWLARIPKGSERHVFFDGSRIAYFRCDHGHRVPRGIIKNVASRFHADGRLKCARCDAVASGLPDDKRYVGIAKNTEDYRSSLEQSLVGLGFDPASAIYEFSQGEKLDFVAKFKCPQGHDLKISLTEARYLMQRPRLMDRKIVPYACEQCAFDGAADCKRESTIFHRLNFLRTWFDNPTYLSNFDPTGKKYEFYSCGKKTPLTGDPHPPIPLRWSTASTPEKAAVMRNPCFICAVENSESLTAREKSAHELRVRGQLLADYVALVTGNEPSRFQITDRSGQPIEDAKIIPTTKVPVIFRCGRHRPQSQIPGNYFNSKKQSGGFCRKCLDDAVGEGGNVEDLIAKSREILRFPPGEREFRK